MQNDDGFLLSSFKLLLLLCVALSLLVAALVLIEVILSMFGLQVTVIQALCIVALLQICAGAVSSAISYCRKKNEQLPGED